MSRLPGSPPSSRPHPHTRPSSPSTPPVARSTPFYKLSSLSELELANLSLADMFIARHSVVSDADLDSLPDLGQSVVEEAEERFHYRAHEALAFAATPYSSAANSAVPSAMPSPTRAGFFSPSSGSSSRASLSPSPHSRLRPPPAYASCEAADPSYFALSRASLYSDGGDSSYSTSSASTPSLWSTAHSPSYSESSAFTGTPADSIACSPLSPRSPANGLALGGGSVKKVHAAPLSLALAQLGASNANDLDEHNAELEQQLVEPPLTAKPATIAARRGNPAGSSLSRSTPGCDAPLKLSLPPLRAATSFSALRASCRGGSKSPAAPAELSHLSAPSSPVRPGTGARLSNGTSKPSYIGNLEAKRALDIQDGVKLKQKRCSGFAF